MSAKFTQHNHFIIYLALAALLGVGLWLRLRFIHTVQLYPDEFVTLLAVRMIGEKGLPIMPSGLFYDHGLLFSYGGSLAAWFGPARLAVRYVSLLAGMLTLGLTFWLGRRWFSPAVGLIAVTGLTIAPVAIEWSSRARMYALLQLLVLLTFWLAYEGLVYDKPRWRWAALLAYLGAMLTHFVAVTLAPPMVVAGLLLYGGQKRGGAASLPQVKKWSVWLEGLVFLIILAIAFLVKRAGQPKGIEAINTATALPGLAQVLAIYGDLSPNPMAGWQAIAPFYLTLPALIFAPFALIAVGGSLMTLFIAPSPARILASPAQIFLSLILLLTTLEMIFFVSPDRRDDKYLFMLLPGLYLLGAQGMAMVGRWGLGLKRPGAGASSQEVAISQSAFHPLLPLILPWLIAGLILTLTHPSVRTLLSNTGDDYDAAFAYVQAHWRPGDVIFTGTPAAAVFYLGRNDFYGVQRRGGYDYRLLTDSGQGQAVDRWLASPAIRTEADLSQTMTKHRVWLVLERWGLQREYYDPSFLQQLLAQTDYASEVQGIFILRSKENPQPLSLNPAHRVEAVLGDQIKLTGYTIEPETATPSSPEFIEGGDAGRLTLYWQALAPLLYDYTVFVHLRQPGGETVAQADHRPLDNLYPASRWPIGEIIRESSQLALPPNLSPGRYELWVGLYRLETGERLPVQNDSSGENAVRLGWITINQ